jgi:hypothetical protein
MLNSIFPRLALRFAMLGLLCLTFVAAAAAQGDNSIDWERAKQLHARSQRGEKLSTEDQAYYDRARATMGPRGGSRAAGGPAPTPRDSMGLMPLTDFSSETYKGETGGLYGNGQNEPPAEQQAAAKRETAKIRPLNSLGFQDADGKVVLLSIGMSNTTQEFSAFKRIADQDADKSPKLVIVDGAQGGMAAAQWADQVATRSGEKVWDVADDRLLAASVTPEQVQVLWIKQALVQQGQNGAYPKHAQKMADDLIRILQLATERYPNLRVAYLSSRIYGGYATTNLNPEPYAYEGAYAVRSVIQAQMSGDAKLNCDARRGEVMSPVLLWGPYLWADGVRPRKLDGLVWTRDDLGADGTHPSDAGRMKVAELLLKFFKADPYARTWFTTAGTSGG